MDCGAGSSGPCEVHLIAVWSCPERTDYKTYVTTVRKALQRHPEWLDNGNAVVAGDFNSNTVWDQKTGGGHSSLVKELEDRGLRSTYHSHFDEEQSKETRPTFHSHWSQNEPFHIDYVFIPKTWSIEALEIGSINKWLAHSDHCPIILDASPTA